jgi:L,D-transpeptidase ErfK/SrfK
MGWPPFPTRQRAREARRRGALIGVAALLVALLGATPVRAAEYALAPGQSAAGEIGRYVVRNGDVFPDIARRFDLGYTALAAANPGVDPWVPPTGQAITIPALYVLPDAPHRGIVVNLAQWRLFYFPPGGGRVETYPLGLGVIGLTTPLGTTRVVRKQANPAWYPPPSIRAEEPDLPAVVPPGPDNPLGAFALYLGWKNYRIHGTNKPDGVGRNVSHGCIRLYPEDIAKLFAAVAVGTPVRVVDQPVTAGWDGDSLYLAVYPNKRQTEEIDTERRVSSDPAEGVRALVTAAAGQDVDAVDWAAVERAANERSGMPVRVAERAASVANLAPPAGEETAQEVDPDAAPSARRGEGQAFDRLLDELIDRASAGRGDPDLAPLPSDPYR